MSTSKPHEHTTYPQFLAALHRRLDQPEALSDYLDTVTSCEHCRSLPPRLERDLRRLKHDAPLVAGEIEPCFEVYVKLATLDPELRRSVFEDEEETAMAYSWLVSLLLLEDALDKEALDEALELAKLGTRLVHGLDVDEYGAVYVANLRALAHAALARVETLAGRPEMARAQLDLARCIARQGDGRMHRELDEVEHGLLGAEAQGLEAVGQRASLEPDLETLSDVERLAVKRALLERLARAARNCRADADITSAYEESENISA